MLTKEMSFAEALVTAQLSRANTSTPIAVRLKNGTGGSLARGDLVILDTSTLSTNKDYTQVIAPTAAVNGAYSGGYHLVCQDVIASGGSGMFVLFGETYLNLNANSGANALVSTRGTNKDATTTISAETKIIARTKETGTGVKRVFFNGMGIQAVKYEQLWFQVGDEGTAQTAATNKLTFRMPFAMTLYGVRGHLGTAATGANLFTVDINEGGASILSTKLTFDASETTTTTAATAAVISDADLADDALMSVDIDQIGNGGSAGAGLKLCLYGYRVL